MNREQLKQAQAELRERNLRRRGVRKVSASPKPLSQVRKRMGELEAAPGLEPGIRALQARALPLGYAAAAP